MTDTPTDRKLSERFGSFKERRELGRKLYPYGETEWQQTLQDFAALGFCNFDAILSALRLSKSHPSAIREAVEACAKIAEHVGVPYGPWQEPSAEDTFDNGAKQARQSIAAAIRAWGEGRGQ